MSDEVAILIVEDETEVEEEVNEAQFPVFIDAETENKFKGFLETELERAQQERQPMYDKLRRWRRMADNENMSGREPAWEGASDVNVPVIPILIKTSASRLKNTFNARKPFWSIKALNEEAGSTWIKRAAVLERYYNIISMSRYDLDLYKKNNQIMTDLPIAGTVYVKVPWTYQVRNVVMPATSEEGEDLGDVERTQVIHNGPEVVPFRVEDVLFRESFQDLQKAPWVSFRHRLDWYQVTLYRDNNDWSNVEELEGSGRTGELEFEHADAQNANTQRNFDRDDTSMIWDVDEVWAYYDVNGDGILEDIMGYYHQKTNTLLFADYNRLGVRPVRQIPFYLRPWLMEGQGMVEVSEGLQDEINALHNMRNDGIHMTEAAQFAVRRGSGVRPKEKVKPGKVWFLDDPMTDIRLLQTSKSYVETANLESLDYSYLERVTGVQDIAGGFSSMLLKSRDTASSQSMRLQAGSEVFMGIIEGVDLAYQDIAELIFRQLVANKDEVMKKERTAERLSEEDIAILEEILSQDITQIPYVLAFKARLVAEAETYEGKRQSILTLVGVYQQFLQGMVPLVQQTYADIDPTVVKHFMGKFVEGGTNLMEKVFQFFGESDTEDYMISADKVETMNQILAAMTGQNSALGGVLSGQMGQQGPGSPAGGQQPGGGGVGAGPQVPPGDGGSSIPPGL
jgi:hypothetical protein